MKPSKQIITCPHCGAQYLPAEIFLPKSLLGNPKDIEKDCYGKIVYYSGHEMDMRESYVCDYCGNTIRVEATVEFRPMGDTRKFNEEYTLKIQDKVSMPEE